MVFLCVYNNTIVYWTEYSPCLASQQVYYSNYYIIVSRRERGGFYIFFFFWTYVENDNVINTNIEDPALLFA